MRRGAYVLKLLFAAVLAVFAVVSLSRHGETKEILAEPVMTAEIETPVPTATVAPTPEPTPEPKPVPEVRDYEQGVEAGNIRYVWQLQEADKNGWGKYGWKAGAECTTACISMALSYLGVDASPEALLDFSSRTYLQSCYGLDEMIEVSPYGSPVYEDGEAVKAFEKMFELYTDDRDGIWSPVLVYLAGNGHYHAVVVIGRDGEDYLVADPTPKGIHRIRISEEGKITTAEDNYLTRYVQSEDSPAGIRSLAQWKLIGAVSSEQ